MTNLTSVTKMCAVLDVGRTTGWALVKSGAVVAVRIRGRTLVTVESVEALIERSKIPAAGTPRSGKG